MKLAATLVTALVATTLAIASKPAHACGSYGANGPAVAAARADRAARAEAARPGPRPDRIDGAWASITWSKGAATLELHYPRAEGRFRSYIEWYLLSDDAATDALVGLITASPAATFDASIVPVVDGRWRLVEVRRRAE